MKNFLSKYFLWLAALGGLGCVWGQLAAPVHSLKLAAGVAVLSLALAGAAAWLQRSAAARARLALRLDGIAARPGLFRLLAGGCALVFAAGWVYLFLPVSREAGALNFYLLSQPLAAWLAVGALEAGLALLLWRGVRWPLTGDWKDAFKFGGIALAVLALLWAGIAVTRVGLDPVGAFWYAPGTPLLLTQVLLAWALGMLLLWGQTRGAGGRRLDIVTGLVLWGLACGLWISTPVTRATTFLPAPAAPNYEPYPFSDAANYDVNAQELLVGNSFSLDPSVKPVYSLLLVFLHDLAGQDYTRLVDLQILLLAGIPVFLYALGLLFSKRAAGLVAAVLFILRDANSIELSNIIQVSHSKLLLSDLPATGLMIVLTVFVSGWLLKPDRRRLWPLAAGGVLGLFIVLRAQVIVAIPFILLGAALVLYKRRRALLVQGALLLVTGILASTLPWAAYSWLSNSQVSSPNYLHLLALQFSDGPDESRRQGPNETAQQFDTRMQAMVVQYVVANPAQVAGSMGAYAVRNLVQSVTFLPLSAQLEVDPVAYARRLPFWDNWNGSLPGEASGMLVLNLALLAFGIGALCARFRAAGAFPLFVFGGYVASLALPMLSGWRFLMPVDWIVIFYLSVGLVELVLLARFLFAGRAAPQPAGLDESSSMTDGAGAFSWPRFALLLAFFVLLNLALPVRQALTAPKYPAWTTEQWLAAYAAPPSGPDAAGLADFLRQPNAVAIDGRALYPRFYPAGAGLHSTGWASFLPRDYNRLGFYVVGSTSADVVLPLEKSPRAFPQAGEVWVFGCMREPDAENRQYVDAWLVVERARAIVFLRASGPRPVCAAGQNP